MTALWEAQALTKHAVLPAKADIPFVVEIKVIVGRGLRKASSLTPVAYAQPATSIIDAAMASPGRLPPQMTSWNAG